MRHATSESPPRYSTLSTVARHAALVRERDVLGTHAEHARAELARQHGRAVGAGDHRAARRPASSGSRFIGGVPMKRATNVFAGVS